jgi:hypothetical protein
VLQLLPQRLTPTALTPTTLQLTQQQQQQGLAGWHWLQAAVAVSAPVLVGPSMVGFGVQTEVCLSSRTLLLAKQMQGTQGHLQEVAGRLQEVKGRLQPLAVHLQEMVLQLLEVALCLYEQLTK